MKTYIFGIWSIFTYIITKNKNKQSTQHSINFYLNCHLQTWSSQTRRIEADIYVLWHFNSSLDEQFIFIYYYISFGIYRTQRHTCVSFTYCVCILWFFFILHVCFWTFERVYFSCSLSTYCFCVHVCLENLESFAHGTNFNSNRKKNRIKNKTDKIHFTHTQKENGCNK